MREQKPERPYNVLFLCTGNSARSILAEALLNNGAGKFVAYSAGSMPKGAVHPQALALLQRLGFATEGLRSKGWDEFAAAGAPDLDFVFTVCDNAANEVCPVWPGQPMTAHWGVPDPAAAVGSEADLARAFRDTFLMLQRRIELFANLPVRSLDRMSLKKHLDEIGRTSPETHMA
jgi:arsenate reductase